MTATGATITPPTGGSLTVTGNTVLNSGTVLNLGIGDGTQQLLSIGGNLTANGTVTVNAPLLGNTTVTPSGTYPIIQYSGSLVGGSSLKLASVIFRGESIDTTSVPGTVQVDVGTPANLIWAPSAGNSLWNVNSTEKLEQLGHSGRVLSNGHGDLRQ